MIGLDSMNISQVQNTINLVKTQITTYKATLTSYRAAYNNATSKIADAKQMLNTAQSTLTTVPDQIPMPISLFKKPATDTNVSSSAVDTVSLQKLKEKAEDRIVDLEEKIDTLEGWQKKLEDKLEELNKQANEYKDIAVDWAKKTAVSVGSTVVSGVSKLVTGKTKKGDNKTTITVDTKKTNELNKESISKNSPLTNVS